MSLLRLSEPSKEGIYQGSKFLKHQILCSPEELALLFQASSFYLFPLTGLGDGNPVSSASFLAEYSLWIEKLKQGAVPSDAELRKVLACAMTADLDSLWLQPVPQNRFITKIAKPVIQIQAHFFTYSSLDGEFRPMTMGMESIFWGLQFSFPQIYQNPRTMELLEVEESANSQLFEKVKKWVREISRATPFSVDGKRINSSIRIGKSCLEWVKSHPQLAAKQIGIFL